MASGVADSSVTPTPAAAEVGQDSDFGDEHLYAEGEDLDTPQGDDGLEADAGASGEERAQDAARSNQDQVPLAVLKAERQKRQELARQLAEERGRSSAYQQMGTRGREEAQPKQPTREEIEARYYADPVGYTHEVFQQAERAASQKAFDTRVAVSEYHMRKNHEDYDQRIEQFKQALKSSPHLARQLEEHPFPAEFAYQAGRTYAEASDVGGSIDKLREKIRAEERTKLEAEIRKELSVRTANDAPRTTVGARGAGATTSPEWAGPTPLNQIVGMHRRR
jgi:hypothetical protein